MSKPPAAATMAEAPRWRPLPAAGRDVPALLVSPVFGASSYIVQVTDLANVWVENLSRREIFRRSFDEENDIDPTEQMDVFLAKIKSAFDSSSPEHGSTSLDLSAPSGADKDGDLTLRITCILPGNLRPFRWPIYLKKGSPSTLASELVLPLVKTHQSRHQEIQSLMGKLKEKDAVISRLVDKLEAMGTGLENVFNALPAKRKATRALAEEKVKGLAQFKEADWEKEIETTRGGSTDVSSLIQDVFGSLGVGQEANNELRASEQLDNWWIKLAKSDSSVSLKAPAEESSSTSKKQVLPKEPIPANDDDEDDEFQVQATPPHLRSPKGRAEDIKDDTEIPTTDDGDKEMLDSQPLPSREKPNQKPRGLGRIGKGAEKPAAAQAPPKPNDEDDLTASEAEDEAVAATPASKPSRSTIGTIGRSKKVADASDDQSPAPPPASQRTQENQGDETGTESEDEHDKQPASPEIPPPRSINTGPRKGGLGRIGGKPKPTSAPAEEQSGPQDRQPSLAPAEEAEGSTAASPAKGTGRRLGTIGKKSAEQAELGVKTEKRQRIETPVAESGVEEEEETEQQRVERKRAELAKDLERKATAPAKKKRRF